jgi:hypothetical protein
MTGRDAANALSSVSCMGIASTFVSDLRDDAITPPLAMNVGTR